MALVVVEIRPGMQVRMTAKQAANLGLTPVGARAPENKAVEPPAVKKAAGKKKAAAPKAAEAEVGEPEA